MKEKKVLVELSDEELESVVGGRDVVIVTTIAQLISAIFQNLGGGGGGGGGGNGLIDI